MAYERVLALGGDSALDRSAAHQWHAALEQSHGPPEKVSPDSLPLPERSVERESQRIVLVGVPCSREQVDVPAKGVEPQVGRESDFCIPPLRDDLYIAWKAVRAHSPRQRSHHRCGLAIRSGR